MTTKEKNSKKSFIYFWALATSLLVVGIFLCPKTVVASEITSERIIELTNKERNKKDLDRIKVDKSLTKAANNKALFLKEHDLFKHSTAEKNFSDWVVETGYAYSYVGENLALDFSSSEDIIEAWMNSPSHKKNLLYPEYQEIGMAVVEMENEYQSHSSVLVVQVFATPIKGEKNNPTKSESEEESIVSSTDREEVEGEDTWFLGLGFDAKTTPLAQARTLSLASILILVLGYLHILDLVRESKRAES